jgi:hypothetical protein
MVDQSIKNTALMARAITFILINRLGGFGMHWEIERPKAEPSECRNRDTLPTGILAIVLLLYMPRARGRPRRGAAWYAFDSRRKRQKNFEKALAIACKRRTRKSKRNGTPPMAHVEEIVPDESIQDYPEHLLFTVPDNWNPPTCFGKDVEPPAPRKTHGLMEDNPAEEFTTCYVEEELQAGTEEKIHTTSGGPPEEGKDETDAQRLAHLSSTQRESQDQPPFLHPEHLELIFETRSMVDDQIFRAIRINQCLDMIYAAYSSTSPR